MKEKEEDGRSIGERPAPVRHLNQVELARRWGLSPRTLERWRWLKQGPAYIKLGGHVAYRLDDVERFERTSLRIGAGIAPSVGATP